MYSAAKRQRTEESAMQLLLGSDYSTIHSAQSSPSEIDHYYNAPNAELQADPVCWWKEHSEQFPKLCKLAQKYLCVPATSVPAERVFSTAGLVVNRLRSRLSSEHVDMLIFLRKNYHHYEKDGMDDDD